MLRWAHFVLFSLAIINSILSYPSYIPEEALETQSSEENDADRKLLEVEHRDGNWRMLTRIIDTMSMLIYQGVVFYAQLVLAAEIITCDDEGNCALQRVKGN